MTQKPKRFGFLKGFLLATVLSTVLLGSLGLWRLGPSLFGVTTTKTDTQVVQALRRDDQIVLVALGIQGIVSEEAKGKVLGVEIAGTGRVQYIQYSYAAKLGIDGKQVVIKKAGPNAYKVTIPDFMFIGHDNEKFQVAVEKNGVISFATPDIDTSTLITEVLSDGAKTEHINTNRDLLEDQAKSFYSGILRGVDPEAKIDFVFNHTA